MDPINVNMCPKIPLTVKTERADTEYNVSRNTDDVGSLTMAVDLKFEPFDVSSSNSLITVKTEPQDVGDVYATMSNIKIEPPEACVDHSRIIPMFLTADTSAVESDEQKRGFVKLDTDVEPTEVKLPNEMLQSMCDGKTSLKKKPYGCDVCNEHFSAKNECCRKLPDKHGLDSHMQNHSRHCCHICKKTFMNKVQLILHLTSHVEKRMYECDICNKTFNAKGHFASHKLTHKAILHHKCNICSASFSLENELASHILLHTLERPHKCNVCNDSFPRKECLSSHMSIHTGGRPYACTICNKMFDHKRRLNEHVLADACQRTYKCNNCNKLCAEKSLLTSHSCTTYNGGIKKKNKRKLNLSRK